MDPPSNRFRSDAFWSAAGTVVPVLAGAASTPFILASLGAGRFTVYALSLAIISFAPSFDFGIARTAFRRIAAIAISDRDRVQAMAHHALTRARIAGVSAAIVLGPVVLATVTIGSSETTASAEVLLPLVMAVLTIPAAITGNTQRAILEGARRFSASAGTRIALGLLTALLPALLCLITNSVLVLVVSLLGLRWIAIILQKQILLREQLLSVRPPGSRHAGAAEYEHVASFRQESAWYAIAAPVSLLMSGFDRFVIIAFTTLTLAELATFLAPQEIALRAIILPAAIIPALMVRIASDNDTSAATRRLLLKVFTTTVAVAFLTCLSLSVSSPAVATLFFGSLPAEELSAVIQMLCIGIFSNAVAQFPAAALNGRGLSQIPAALQLFELPLFLMTLTILVETWGALGAATAWSIRIAVDTMLLLIAASYRTPMITARRWHVAHALGLLALILSMLV